MGEGHTPGASTGSVSAALVVAQVCKWAFFLVVKHTIVFV